MKRVEPEEAIVAMFVVIVISVPLILLIVRNIFH